MSMDEMEKDDSLSPEDAARRKTTLNSVKEVLGMLLTDSKITGQDLENEKGRKEIETVDTGSGKGSVGGVTVNFNVLGLVT
jgi:hypothetical protein